MSSEPAPTSPGNVVPLAALTGGRGQTLEVGALPAQADLNIYQGTTFAFTVTVSTEGEPADLSGVVAEAQIRRRASDEEIMAAFIVAVDDNVISVQLTDEQTAGLRSGVWDLRLTGDTGVSVPVRGAVWVTERVTR